MRQAISWIAGVAVALGLAVSAQAQTQTVNGQITAKDESANTFTVRTDAGQTVVFHAQDTTTFRSQGQEAAFDGLQVGDRVVIQADPATPGGSPREARSVEVRPASAAPAPGRTQTDVQGDVDTNRSLPATAGEFPLLALLGGASMGWGLVLRGLRGRRQ